MNMLTPELSQQLVDTLLRIPGSDTVAVRNLLLNDLPPTLVGGIVRSENPALDLAGIVTAVAQWDEPTEKVPPLYMLLDNAVELARDSPMKAQLVALRNEVPQQAQPGPWPAGEARPAPAQSHDQSHFRAVIEAMLRDDWAAAAKLATELPADYPGLAPILAQVRAGQQWSPRLYQDVVAAFRVQDWARVLSLAADLPATDPIVGSLVEQARQHQARMTMEGTARRAQHDAPVYDLAWAPNGGYYASASADGSVCLWTPGSTESAWSVEGPGGELNAVGWSPDGRLLAAGGRAGTVVLWDGESGARRGTLEHSTAVHALAWSPISADLLATGDAAGVVRLWNVPRRAVQQILAGHTGAVLSLAWAPDGTRLVSGAWDATASLWDAETGRRLVVARNYGAGLHCVAWGPRGLGIAVGSNDKHVRVWDEQLGQVQHTLAGLVAVPPSPAQVAYQGGSYTAPSHEGEVYALAWRPDGVLLASGASDFTIKLWDTATWAQQAVLTGHQGAVNCVAWSPDGQWLVSGSEDTTIRRWPVK